MKKSRFASYLLTGKAATLPFMIGNSLADVMPTYTELLAQKASIIEVPANGVRLLTTTVSVSGSSYGGGSYGGSGYDAQVCSSPVPGMMNVVITGVKTDEFVYLVASSDKDSPTNLAIHPSARIGTANMTLVSGFKFVGQESAADASSLKQAVSAVSVPVDMNKLQAKNLFAGGQFYLQAFIFPTLDPINVWQQARVSELDLISVSTAGCSSSYGGPATPYGGTTY